MNEVQDAFLLNDMPIVYWCIQMGEWRLLIPEAKEILRNYIRKVYCSFRGSLLPSAAISGSRGERLALDIVVIKNGKLALNQNA